MILDDALAYIERDGPMDRFSHPNAMPDAAAAIAAADVSRDAALLARVRRLLHKSAWHHRLADAVRHCWVRAELALGNHAAVAEEIWTATYGAGYFSAAATAGVGAWPLVRLLVDRAANALGSAQSNLAELAAALVAPDMPGWEDRFAELCSRSVRFAANALAHLRRTRDIAIAGMLSPLIPHLDMPEGQHVVDAMQAAAREGESLAALVPLLDDRALSGARAEDIAHVLTLASLGDGSTARWLDDPRPAVRLGAVRALANDPRLITFARDPDVTVRRTALAALSNPGPADLVTLVSALDVAGDDVADILVGMADESELLAACDSVASVSALRLAASLRRQHGEPTRACTRCKRIPRSESWTSDGRPAEMHELNVVREIARATRDESDWKLVRCRTCSACYATTYWCEDEDPLMRRESWTVKRLTLAEIQRDNGANFVPDWTAALVADLDHPDPHWRTEAAHDLAHDLLAAGRFDRIEIELLRHPRREVAREALRALSDAPVDPPISAAVLEALAASTDEDTRAFATTLLTVQRGTGALDDLELASYPVLTGIEVLIRRGGSVSPRFAARFLEHELARPPYIWRFAHLVEKVAFAEHLPATLVRLRPALVDPSTRSRALELVKALANKSLLDDETLAVALQQADTDLEATLAIALAARTTLIPEIANSTLRVGTAHDARKVIGRLGEALARSEDIGWAIPALGAHVLRHAEGADAAVMLDQLASKGVDLTDAVQTLFAALERVMPSSAQFAAHALVRHHVRRGETDAVLTLLCHGMSSVRGDAAAVLADVGLELPAAIRSRLHEMTTDRASHPRWGAEKALRAHGR